MRPAARVAEAIALLEAIEASPRPADDLVQGHFRARRFIGSKDRRAIGDLVFGVLRHRARLSWHIERAGLEPAPRALAIGYLSLVAAEPVEPLFAGTEPHGPPPLSAEERALPDAGPPEVPDMPEPVRVECPPWAEQEMRAQLGEGFGPELAALREPAALDVRVARRKAGRDVVLERLVGEGLDAEATPHSPDGMRIRGRVALRNHPLFRDGTLEVQDEGSQLAALMCDVSPGMQVVDFCAGAGGKSLALADVMAGKGRIVACDVDPGRLAQAKKRAGRAGLDNIEPRTLRDARDGWIARQKGKFDRVLVDAPCSGSGAWRRSPWARWRPPDLEALTELQTAILASAARLVRPGGRLVYVTCSLLACENRGPVAALLDGRSDFRLVPAGDALPRNSRFLDRVASEDGTVLLTPLRAGTDGFFIAAMERATDG